MDALALMIDVTNQLCNAYSDGGQTIECINIETEGQTPALVASNVPANTTWLAFTSFEVCYENFENDDFYLLQPVIGCESEPANCLTASIRPKFNTLEAGSIFSDACQTVPFLHCGDCPAGESLWIGANQELVCGGDEPSQDPPNVMVTGNWCIWLFQDIRTDFGQPVPQIRECLSQDQIARLTEKVIDIHEAACNRLPINCTTNILTFGADEEDPSLIQEGVPFVPPITDPTAVAPVKKWFIVGRMRACLKEPFFGNSEDTTYYGASYQIKCGGAVVDFGSFCPWRVTNSGTVTICGPWFAIASNVSCATDLDLEICVRVQNASFLPLTAASFEYEGELTAICF